MAKNYDHENPTCDKNCWGCFDHDGRLFDFAVWAKFYMDTNQRADEFELEFHCLVI